MVLLLDHVLNGCLKVRETLSTFVILRREIVYRKFIKKREKKREEKLYMTVML